MTGLPDAVQVGPFRFELVSTDEAHARAVRAGADGDLYGLTEYREQRITLCPAQAPDLMRVTLIHEVLHTLLFATGGSQLLEDTEVVGIEEALTQVLAPAITDLLRRNPTLVEFLTA